MGMHVPSSILPRLHLKTPKGPGHHAGPSLGGQRLMPGRCQTLHSFSHVLCVGNGQRGKPDPIRSPPPPLRHPQSLDHLMGQLSAPALPAGGAQLGHAPMSPQRSCAPISKVELHLWPDEGSAPSHPVRLLQSLPGGMALEYGKSIWTNNGAVLPVLPHHLKARVFGGSSCRMPVKWGGHFPADRFGHLLRGGLDALGWLRYPSHCTILPCLCISRPENPAPPFAAGGFHFTLRPNILEAPRCWACPVLDGYALLIFSFH